jgi:tetratricopeptide (TPR) repeat protein
MDLTNREPDGPDVPDATLNDAIAEFGARFPNCPKPAVLQAAQSGVLPVEAGDMVRDHMAACAACTALARDLSNMDEAPLAAKEQARIWDRIRAGIAAEESALKTAAPRSGWRALLFRPVPVAILAAAVILAVIGGRLLHQPRPRPTAALGPARQPEAVAPPDSTAFRLDKPPVMLPASALLVWRGAAEAGSAQDKELREALIPYAADQYAEAARRLESLTKEDPRLETAHFYLGICRLFLERNDDAAASLKAARGLAHPLLADEADWYLALAYHRTGRNGEARPLLEKLCHATGKNSGKACAGLRELLKQ